ncbi:Alpha-L-rhamnosidase N-terminal domain-containing protein [Armatimonadetes bacterium DC]|nr:Alpha-L-rhamnosidase N-terminal domain-containing protein [Armatimonadetes bacterium DC]
MLQWRARWIWSQGEPAPRNFYWCVRKEFELPRGFRKVQIAISADTRYLLWFNGRFIGHGPVRAFHGHWYYDLHDVTEHAHAGLNAIAVLVHHYGVGTFQYDFVRGRGRGGLIAQVDCDGKTVAASDSSWLNVPHPAFERRTVRMSCQLGFDEHYDARRSLGDWTMPRFDDYEWNEAVEIGEAGCPPWGELQPRPIPFLTLEPVYPQRILRARVVRPPQSAWAFDLKPLLAEGDLTANPRTLVGMIATVLRAETPATVRLWSVHHGLRPNDVRLNGQPIPVEGGRATFTLTPGEHLLTLNVSRWYHDWYYYPVLDWDDGAKLQLVNPLMERADYPWVVLGPFESEQDPEFQSLWSATTPDALHRHRAVQAVDPFYSAQANVFGLTTLATPLPETPRIEDSFAGIRGVDDATVIHPPETGDVELWLDFGREVVGFVELELEAPEGTVFDFNGFEYLDPTNPDRVQWTNGLNNTFRYVARRGWQWFRSTVRRGFRYATLTIRFPEGARDPVLLRAVHCVMNVYPYESRGAFECSDPLLNRIYEISRETVRLCSEDTFVDCPTYEQTFWVGDSRNEALFAYAGFGEYALARRCLLLAAQSLERSPLVESQVPSAWENILTAWALLWAIACHEHYLFTGDRAFVEAIFPAIRQQNENLHTRYINSAGLLEIRAWNMLDWADMDTPSEGVVSHQNMWLVKVWEDTAKLAEVVGETLLAQAWRQWAQELRQAINRHLWVESQRAYTDCLRPDGQPSPVFSQQTQIVAYLCDIPTPERKPIIEGYLHQAPDHFVKIGSPFMMAFLLESLIRAGHRREAVARMRDAWGMMVEMGAVTCWEVFPRTRPRTPLQAHEVGWFTRSHCHAWSAAPVYALPACLLGIEPLEPGFSRFRLAPDLCGLEWAYGAFPTPHGIITYAMEQRDARLYLKLTIPEGTRAIIGDTEYAAGAHELLL